MLNCIVFLWAPCNFSVTQHSSNVSATWVILEDNHGRSTSRSSSLGKNSSARRQCPAMLSLSLSHLQAEGFVHLGLTACIEQHQCAGAFSFPSHTTLTHDRWCLYQNLGSKIALMSFAASNWKRPGITEHCAQPCRTAQDQSYECTSYWQLHVETLNNPSVLESTLTPPHQMSSRRQSIV